MICALSVVASAVAVLAASALGGMKAMHAMGGMIPDVAHIDEPYWYMHGGNLAPQESPRLRSAAM